MCRKFLYHLTVLEECRTYKNTSRKSVLTTLSWLYLLGYLNYLDPFLKPCPKYDTQEPNRMRMSAYRMNVEIKSVTSWSRENKWIPVGLCEGKDANGWVLKYRKTLYILWNNHLIMQRHFGHSAHAHTASWYSNNEMGLCVQRFGASTWKAAHIFEPLIRKLKQYTLVALHSKIRPFSKTSPYRSYWQCSCRFIM